MQWHRLGRITTENASYPRMDGLDDELRVYFARKDELGRSRIFYLTAGPKSPSAVR